MMQGEVASVDSLSVTIALPCKPRMLSERSYRLQRFGTVTYKRCMDALGRMRLLASAHAASGSRDFVTTPEYLKSPSAIISASWAVGHSNSIAGKSIGNVQCQNHTDEVAVSS